MIQATGIISPGERETSSGRDTSFPSLIMMVIWHALYDEVISPCK